MASAVNLLNKLVKEKAPPKPKAKAPDRPVKVFKGSGADALTSWVASAVAFDIMEARKDTEATVLNAGLMEEFSEQLYAQGFQPVNPKVRVERNGQVDHEANFTVQGKFKLGAKTSDELLANLKVVLGDEQGQRLFDTEIDTTPLTTLRPFNELVLGHYEGKDFVPATAEEQAVATKLLTFVQGEKATPLTDAERDLVLIHQDQMKVKPGFFDRVAGYCEDVSTLKALFRSVITPVHFLSHAKFAESDTPAERHNRLVEAVAGILGTAQDDE